MKIFYYKLTWPGFSKSTPCSIFWKFVHRSKIPKNPKKLKIAKIRGAVCPYHHLLKKNFTTSQKYVTVFNATANFHFKYNIFCFAVFFFSFLTFHSFQKAFTNFKQLVMDSQICKLSWDYFTFYWIFFAFLLFCWKPTLYL